VGLDRVPSGKDLPNDFNVVVEISMHSEPIKYEVDKESGAIFVDRFMSTAMHYPCNYGYIPHTIAGDGDPVDVLVMSQFALPPGVVVRCRPIGMLKMTDEAGDDAKVLAVPVDKLTMMYRSIESRPDLALFRALQGPGTGQVRQGQWLGGHRRGQARDHDGHQGLQGCQRQACILIGCD
jgi:inorganic pyrophosphatase